MNSRMKITSLFFSFSRPLALGLARACWWSEMEGRWHIKCVWNKKMIEKKDDIHSPQQKTLTYLQTPSMQIGEETCLHVTYQMCTKTENGIRSLTQKTHTHTHTHAHRYTHTHTHTRAHTHTHTSCMELIWHICIHTCTYIYTHTHVHIHTHTHTRKNRAWSSFSITVQLTIVVIHYRAFFERT